MIHPDTQLLVFMGTAFPLLHHSDLPRLGLISLFLQLLSNDNETPLSHSSWAQDTVPVTTQTSLLGCQQQNILYFQQKRILLNVCIVHESLAGLTKQTKLSICVCLQYPLQLGIHSHCLPSRLLGSPGQAMSVQA